MAGQNYRDLKAWQLAMDLVVLVYDLSTRFPAEERFGWCAQVRRAAVSVPSNIAEGQGRRSEAEFRHGLAIAHGSLREVETQLLIASRLGYAPPETVSRTLDQAAEVGRCINGLWNSLDRGGKD